MSLALTQGENPTRLDQIQDAIPFTVGIIPSEIDQSLEVSIPILQELGVRHVELSTVDRIQFPQFSANMREHIYRQLSEAGIWVGVSGTEIFKFAKLGDLSKGELLTHPMIEAEFAELHEAIAHARFFGSKIIRLYAFRRDDMVGLGNPSPILVDGGAIPEEIVAKASIVLAAAGDLAAEAGMMLAVENVRSCWANTGVNLGRLVAAADHPAVRVCWDAANDFVAGGNPSDTGYAAVRPYVIAAHFKSATIVDQAAGLTAWMPIGRGDVNMTEQISFLRRDGFSGLASLETHWKPEGGNGIDGTRHSFAGLLQAMQESTRAGA